MASDTYPARRERSPNCATCSSRSAPTRRRLCGDWTTRDLAAHLVVRERRPDAAIGIMFSKAAGYTDKVQAGVADTDWTELVDTVRSGPPIWSPTRRSGRSTRRRTPSSSSCTTRTSGAPADTWEPRDLDDDLTDPVRNAGKMAKRLVKSSPVGIVLEPTDDSRVRSWPRRPSRR
jgi:uncharacterized protein (TIGR03085 family)